MKTFLNAGILFSFVLIVSGCLSVPKPEPFDGLHETGDENVSFQAAKDLQNKAVDRDGVLKAIAAMEHVVRIEPNNIEARALQANMYILLGAAYETKTSDKRKAYRDAMSLSAEAMMRDASFAKRINDGATVWEAAEVLSVDYIALISFWSTALFYQYDECLAKALKPFNLRWIRRAERMLGYAYKLDPDWGGGQLYFSYGIYYMMPKVAGGDLEKSEVYFAKAIEAGDGWLLNRWGRARYLYKRTGNTEGQIEDFKWVVAQDPYTMNGPVCWNVFIQRDAQEILQKKGLTE